MMTSLTFGVRTVQLSRLPGHAASLLQHVGCPGPQSAEQGLGEPGNILSAQSAAIGSGCCTLAVRCCHSRTPGVRGVARLFHTRHLMAAFTACLRNPYMSLFRYAVWSVVPVSSCLCCSVRHRGTLELLFLS